MSRHEGVCGGVFSFTSIMASGASGGGIGLTELLSIARKMFADVVGMGLHWEGLLQLFTLRARALFGCVCVACVSFRVYR